MLYHYINSKYDDKFIAIQIDAEWAIWVGDFVYLVVVYVFMLGAVCDVSYAKYIGELCYLDS